MVKQSVKAQRPDAYSELDWERPGYVVRDPWAFEAIGRGKTPAAAWADALANLSVPA